jgi:multicomponent Na+:H+ antiporter subunit E
VNAIKKSWKIIAFIAFYVIELLLANLRVLYDVLTPRHRMKPGFIAIQLNAKSDLEILILANLLAMTPGTLSIDVSPDKKLLYLHVMYLDNVEEFRKMIKTRFESRVLEVLR